ncbi:T9SS type B sorting domain-containing protein [Kordia sp.]|uniref:T9SS type B sorting domain-containing protein n=1 Tax=Kordia sp. TaxID=1965332 RepID=UPI003B5B5A10
MSKIKIGFIIFLGFFAFSGNSIDALSETTSNIMMDPIEYVICDEDGFAEINILDIQSDILSEYNNGVSFDDEAVLISTGIGHVIKIGNLSSATTTSEVICGLPAANPLSDIAVDEDGVVYVTNFNSIRILDETDCSTTAVPGLTGLPSTNSLSFDTQGNMYYGGGNSSVVYRYDSDEMSAPYIWHNFGSGAPSGDFVMLGDKMYIAWNSNGIRLYEVTLDDNFNYVSHIDLGTILNSTFGLASELGELYGVSSSRLYRINLDTFTFTTIVTNDFTHGAWWGAAGLHEAFSFEASSHVSPDDANNDVNPLPDNWTNTQQGGQTIYIRIENTVTGTFDVVEVNIVVTDTIPELTDPSELVICDNDTNFTYDLTTVETELLQNVTNAVNVTYYNSEEDATLSVNAVNANYTTTLNPETIYVRVENVDDGCFAITQFTISAVTGPSIETPNNLTQCADENNGVFDLTQVENELLQNNSIPVNVSYHTTMTDATNGTNSIATNYQISSTQETIYVRVENTNDASCFATTQFEIIFNESLQITTPNDITECESVNNGVFDLTQVEAELLINSPNNVVVTYHESITDATENTNAISTNYTATTNQNTIYIRVQSTDTNCFAITQFDVISIERLGIETPSDLTLCEGENNGLFDLTQVENELLQNVTQNTNITYHISLADAEANTNPIDTNYTLTSGQATIFVRVNNTNTVCFETTQFTVQILNNPSVESMVNSPSARLLTDCYIDSNTDGYFNLNDIYPQIVTNGNTSYTLEFYLSEDNAEQEINSIDAIYYAMNDTEEIFVSVTNQNGCKSITNFFVNPDCYDTIVDISNIKFPAFFTPNNDMANDTWNVKGISIAVQQTAIMYIFDRYGKLLYYFRPGQIEGWNGTYRGKPMPSNDYWYKFETSEGQSFSGSFSLIR